MMQDRFFETPILNFPDKGEAVGEWIANPLSNGLQPEEIGVFVQSWPQFDRAAPAVCGADQGAGLPAGEWRRFGF